MLSLHDEVLARYHGEVTEGHINHQEIAGIIDTTFWVIHGQPVYDTIFKQAASLMERIIRLHPFQDGNKRTALLTACYFLAKNGHYMVVPLDTIRFMVSIADNTENTEEDIKELHDNIAAWLKARTAKTGSEYQSLIDKYLKKPVRKLLLISLTGIGIIYVRRKLRRWMASDMHPEYARDMGKTVEFLSRVRLNTIRMAQRKGHTSD